MKVTIIGQGYVGLPLSIAAAQSGYEVYGLDHDDQKVQLLQSGRSVTQDISNKDIKSALKSGRYQPTCDYSVINKSEIVIICVPTPLTDDQQPDLSALIDALTKVALHKTDETLIIVESTIQPGASEDILIPLISVNSKLKDKQIYFAYSPERIDPTNEKWNIKNTPKLVAGYTPESLARAVSFYKKFVKQVIECESLKIAEIAKVLENSYRLVNISLINEISDFCEKINVDVLKVIDAASSKPYGFMPFYPGLGAGGHCIPVDPMYLLSAAKLNQSTIKLIDVAKEINQNRAKYFIELAIQRFGDLKGKRVLVVGVAYKPNVADVRETPAEALIKGLKEVEAKVFWHDELVNKWNNEKSVEISSEYDLAILATRHDYLDLEKLRNVPILDTKGSI